MLISQLAASFAEESENNAWLFVQKVLVESVAELPFLHDHLFRTSRPSELAETLYAR